MDEKQVHDCGGGGGVAPFWSKHERLVERWHGKMLMDRGRSGAEWKWTTTISDAAGPVWKRTRRRRRRRRSLRPTLNFPITWKAHHRFPFGWQLDWLLWPAAAIKIIQSSLRLARLGATGNCSATRWTITKVTRSPALIWNESNHLRPPPPPRKKTTRLLSILNDSGLDARTRFLLPWQQQQSRVSVGALVSSGNKKI